MAENTKKRKTTEQKRLEQAETRHIRNTAAKSKMKTVIKKAVTAIGENSNESSELTRLAIKTIDMTASKGIIHKNKAARKKSRIMLKLNKTNA